MENVEIKPQTETGFDYSQFFDPHHLDDFKKWQDAKPEGMDPSLWILKLIEVQKKIERSDITREKKEEIVRAWKIENGLI